MPTTTCPNCGRIIPLEMEELSIWIQCAKCDLEFVPTTGEMRSRPSKASTPVSPSRENTRGDRVWSWIVEFVVCLAVLVLFSLLAYRLPIWGKINKSNYEKIHNGMTESQVEAILGEGRVLRPGAFMFGEHFPKIVVWRARRNRIRDPFVFAEPPSITVEFVGGKVTAKRQDGL